MRHEHPHSSFEARPRGLAPQDDGNARVDPTKKAPAAAFPNSAIGTKRQCASAQTFFLVKYINPVNRIRNTNTCMPRLLRASICGSAAHIRNVVTSLEYCATVAGDPSSNVTWPSFSGFGILMAWPGQ